MKVLIINRKLIRLIPAALVIIGIFAAVNNPAIVGASTAKRELPIYCVQRDSKVVSLTFDAAWGNEDTQQLVDILEKYKIKATFFVVGEWVDKYPESVKALYDAGHEIMNHSNTHAHMTKLSRDQIIEDVSVCNDKIEKITGVRPTLFRAPYGEYDNKVISALKNIDMHTIQWDVDSLDWRNLSASEIAKRVTGQIKPGSIALFHNAAKHTPEALPYIIENLLSQGYKMIPVSEIIHRGDYTLDHTGMQIPQ